MRNYGLKIHMKQFCREYSTIPVFIANLRNKNTNLTCLTSRRDLNAESFWVISTKLLLLNLLLFSCSSAASFSTTSSSSRFPSRKHSFKRSLACLRIHVKLLCRYENKSTFFLNFTANKLKDLQLRLVYTIYRVHTIL